MCFTLVKEYSFEFNPDKSLRNFKRSLTKKLRQDLKKPQGLLIEGSFTDTMNKLKRIIEKVNPSCLISVGDIVTKHMIESGIAIDLLIVDNKTMRRPIQPLNVDVDQSFYATNPPGTITNEAWIVIKQAINCTGKTKVIIEGEEDLLTLVTVLLAPENSIVVYGQPNKGIVIINVNKETREKMHHIVKRMIKSSKS